MQEQPILSICIPIYNRIEYLRRSLNIFLRDKELFEEDIHLYISDNCSTDDLESLCDEYKSNGLKLEYHRNKKNLGMDGNFINCFKHAKGKYTYLLGSDDTPVEGFLIKILDTLRVNDLGLLHLSENQSDEYSISKNTSVGDFLVKIHVWITFLSGNIVQTAYIENVDMDKYKGTEISQVPVYLEAACGANDNAVLSGRFFESGNDSKNNGGYNLFQVFCENLLTIIHEKVDEGKLTEKQFKAIKKSMFCKWMIGFYVRFFIRHDCGSFKMVKAKKILHKWYGCELYYYMCITRQWIKHFINVTIVKKQQQ